MDVNKILHVATLAGEIILTNGGEIYRVEETILRICYSYGLKSAHSFVTPTGIIVSAMKEIGDSTATVRRIHSRDVNLEKIDMVNNLSRLVSTDPISLDELESRLITIQESKGYDYRLIILFSAISTGLFALVFNGGAIDALAAFILGLLIKSFYLIMDRIQMNTFLINILSGALATFCAYSFISLGFGGNIDIIIVSTIMLLVPGMLITNAIRDTIAGDLVSGISRASEAFFIAVAIAVGSGMVYKFAEKLFT